MSSGPNSLSFDVKLRSFGFLVAKFLCIFFVPASHAMQILGPDVSSQGVTQMTTHPRRSHFFGSLDAAGTELKVEHLSAADTGLRQAPAEYAQLALRLTMADASGTSQPVLMVPVYLVAICLCLLGSCTFVCLFSCCVPKPAMDKKLVSKVERALMDTEKDPEVRWLNDAVAAFWPHLDAYIQNLMVNTVQPALKHELGFPLRNMVSFGACSLGDKVPRLGPIVVRERGTDTVILEVALNMDLGLNISISNVGVKRVILSGVLSVIFYPMISEPPFFAGLQIFFANPPNIDLEFSGLAELAENPHLHQTIRGAICRVVTNMFVSPARLAIDLDEEDTTHITDIKFPDPIGILRFTATGLHIPNKDYAVADVRAVVKVGSESKDLSISEHGAVDMPVYDQSARCNFDVLAKEGWAMRSESLVGQAKELHLDTFATNAELKESRVKLDDLNHKERNSEGGVLSVKSRWFNMSKTTGLSGARLAGKVGGPAQLLLSVKVLELSGVSNNSLNSFISLAPFVVRVSVGESIERVSGPSFPKYVPVWAPLYTREMIVKLASKGMPLPEISELVELDEKLTDHLLRYSKETDEGKQTRMHKDYCAAVDKVRSVSDPQWNEVLPLLLPWELDSKICIEVKAHSGTRLGKKLELPLSDVVSLPGGELKGPFPLEDESQHRMFSLAKSAGLMLHAELKVKWYEAS